MKKPVTLRGVPLIVTVIMIAELGDLTGFENQGKFMRF